jgi:hypothetical protein
MLRRLEFLTFRPLECDAVYIGVWLPTSQSTLSSTFRIVKGVPLLGCLEYGGSKLTRSVVPLYQCVLRHIPDTQIVHYLLREPLLDLSCFPHFRRDVHVDYTRVCCINMHDWYAYLCY